MEQHGNFSGYIVSFALVIFLGGILFYAARHPRPRPPSTAAAPALTYTFNVDGTLDEKNAADESPSPYFWVASGGRLVIESGVGSTLQGDQTLSSKWRRSYARSNPRDTDNGLHPQNTFRLVSKYSGENVGVSAQFRIERDNVSESPNRNESNGLLLMSRYLDHNTLYYAGIRVDGTAVIKKKYEGVYYTLAQTPLFKGHYHRARTPNLLPHGTWLSIRSETVTLPDQTVEVRLFMHAEGEQWKEILEASDHGQDGNPPITQSGYTGIRTDFMDVSFDDFTVEELAFQAAP